MASVELIKTVNGTSRVESAKINAAAPRRAIVSAASNCIEALEPRQLLSIAHPLPALLGGSEAPAIHAMRIAPATVVTNKLDYTPGQIAAIIGKGFGGGELVQVQVLHIDGTPNTAPEHQPWTVRAARNGTFHTSYTVGADDLNTTLQLTAIGLTTHRTASEMFKDSTTATTTTLSSSTAPAPAPIVQPSHIVVVVEEDRGANAIGDVANMPYFNQLASSGLVYSNSHGLNTTSQEGQMSYLGLYSGSTQGVTDNGNHGIFTTPTLAQSLANKGLSFRGYAESLPYNGDTTDNYAADPTNAAYDDLYVRAYNPMAQFSSVGAGLTNANVNLTFVSFPTSATGYASLPTVSFVIPNTRHNTHGSNDTDPYATDPAAYNLLRQNADTWLHQKLDGYLQWAKQNNSLLIVTDDEGDRAHNFAGGFATIINGSVNLFSPGVDTSPVTPYNILRTVEDMYGLAQLGGSATVAGLDTNGQGKLGLPQAGGSSVVGQGVTFTATVSPVSGGGTPTGTVQFIVDGANLGSPAALSNGSATSPSDSFLSSGNHSVSAVYSSDSQFSASTAATLVQAVARASTTTALASSAISSVWSQSVTLTATVSDVAPGGGIATGLVTFMDGATTFGTTAFDGSDTATFTTSSLAVASHTLTAIYAGDANYAGSASAPRAQNVAQDGTALALASSVNPAVAGQSITFIAAVTPAAPGTGTPSGTVTFYDGTAALGAGTLDGTGMATFATANLSVNLHSITAAYASDGNFAASSSAANQVVSSPAFTSPSTTTIASSVNPSVFGQAVAFTATIAPADASTDTPTGTVQFVVDGVNAGNPVALINGSATSASLSALAVAGHNVTAMYSGDSTFGPSSAPNLSQIVSASTTGTSLVSSSNPSVSGQSISFTATISVNLPGAGTPTGTVSFLDGTTPIGSAPLNSSGNATFTTSSLAVASHSITAVYAGDANFAGSTSAPLAQVTNQAATTAALTSSSNPSAAGQSVPFTATITVNSPGAGTPTGMATFLDGTTPIGSAPLNSSGKATFTTSLLAVASHSITAVYAGDANFAGSTSAPLAQVTNQATTTAALTSSSNPSVPGQSVTFTATISVKSPGTGTPTGTATFLDGTTPIGSAPLNSSGKATFATSSLAAASHSITAVYGGDANFTGSTSAVVIQQVTTTPPANNNFASATTITGSTATLTGTNAGATKEAGEPAHAGNAGGASVWWSWKAPSTGVVALDTAGSNFDTLLAVYTGSSVSALTAVPNGSNNNDPAGGVVTSKVAFAVTSGTIYKIAVDGYNGATGNITLHLNFAVTPAAPTGVTATKASFINKVHVAWTASNGATAYEVWRGTTSSSSAAVKISAADVTGATAYDDTSALAGIAYYYWVKAKNLAGTSAFSASAQGYLQPANDLFSNATVITGTSATLAGTNFGASKEAGEPIHAGNAGGKSVWWTWTATASGTVTIDTHGSNFDTLLAVYTGSSVSALTPVPGGSNDDDLAGGTTTSKVSFAVTAGTTYRIAVDGYGGVSGSIALHLSFV